MRKLVQACLASGALLGVVALGGCEAPKSQVTYLISAAAQINPDASNRPSPVVVRFYELKSSGIFESAEFFALYSEEAKTLGATLIARKEVQIGPSETREIVEDLQPGTRAIGIVAAFRNLSSNKWRAVFPVKEGTSVPIEVTLGPNGISVKSPSN